MTDMIEIVSDSSRKGQASVPIMQIIKIVAAILVAVTILAIIIPIIFDGLDAACELLRHLLESMRLTEMIVEYFEILEC